MRRAISPAVALALLTLAACPTQKPTNPPPDETQTEADEGTPIIPAEISTSADCSKAARSSAEVWPKVWSSSAGRVA